MARTRGGVGPARARAALAGAVFLAPQDLACELLELRFACCDAFACTFVPSPARTSTPARPSGMRCRALIGRAAPARHPVPARAEDLQGPRRAAPPPALTPTTALPESGSGEERQPTAARGQAEVDQAV